MRAILGPAPPYWFQPLDYPTEEAREWTRYPIFEGPTAALEKLDCHFRVFPSGTTERLHEHPEEQLVILLSGEIETTREDPTASGGVIGEQATVGSILYNAPHKLHANYNPSPDPATYLVFTWFGEPAAQDPTNVHSGSFSFRNLLTTSSPSTEGGARTPIFEFPTGYLRKLRCVLATLRPGASYVPKIGPYEIAILLLSGTVEAFGHQIESRSVIFCSADQPREISSVGTAPAEYLVFEFHP